MPEPKSSEPDEFEDIAKKSQEAGIADESAGYDVAMDKDDEIEPEAHPS